MFKPCMNEHVYGYVLEYFFYKGHKYGSLYALHLSYISNM